MFAFDKKSIYKPNPILVKMIEAPLNKESSSSKPPYPWKIKEIEYSIKTDLDYFSDFEDFSSQPFYYNEGLVSYVAKKKEHNIVVFYFDKMVIYMKKLFSYQFLNWVHPWFIIRHRYFYRGY
jgi:hypothetical protein